MPNLVTPGLAIRDVRARRIPFRRVRMGQIFYAEGRWYQRRSKQKAVRADVKELETIHFRQATIVRVFDERSPTQRRVTGPTYEEFIANCY